MSGIVSGIGKVFQTITQTAVKVGSAVAGVGSTLFTAGAAAGAGPMAGGGTVSRCTLPPLTSTCFMRDVLHSRWRRVVAHMVRGGGGRMQKVLWTARAKWTGALRSVFIAPNQVAIGIPTAPDASMPRPSADRLFAT